MTMLMLYRPLTKAEAEKVRTGVETFFQKFPRRRVCRTNIHGGVSFHRGKVREEVTRLMGSTHDK